MSDSFYSDVIRQLMKQETMTAEQKTLVVAGGPHDRDVIKELGFKDVTLSNLDERMDASLYAPFEWSYQDAENLTFADNSFDWCVEHDGLHHCHSPHRALLEMLRVARKGVLLIEPYDNLVTRLGVLLGAGNDYEHAAVYYNDCKYGGVKNSPIPNYIYRWTRAEIKKTVLCHNPYGLHQFQFIHQFRFPWTALRGKKNKLPFLLVCALRPFFILLNWVFPTQSNYFAAIIIKPDLSNDVFPWLAPSASGLPSLNRKWLDERYQSRRSSHK